MNRNLALRKCRASMSTWKSARGRCTMNTDAFGSRARAMKYHALRLRGQS